jgi:predicted Co/Zn/Cd cation transporter (cation efflux family)
MGLCTALLWLACLLAFISGWCMNIIALFRLAYAVDPSIVVVLIRLAGVPLVPLGAMAGWFL